MINCFISLTLERWSKDTWYNIATTVTIHVHSFDVPCSIVYSSICVEHRQQGPAIVWLMPFILFLVNVPLARLQRVHPAPALRSSSLRKAGAGLDGANINHVHGVFPVLAVPLVAVLEHGRPVVGVIHGAGGVGFGVGAHAAAGGWGHGGRAGVVGLGFLGEVCRHRGGGGYWCGVGHGVCDVCWW